jgi:opacity protein-like surface antigen
MGAFEGRRGPWGLATDVIYLDLGATKKETREFSIGEVGLPADVSADLKLGLTGWLWTLAGSYEVVQQNGLSVNVLAGARMLDLQEDLHWNLDGDISSLPVVDSSGSADARETQWDAIVGVKGRVTLGADRQWFLPYYLDVGAGESDLTWQGMAGLGYSFDSIDVVGVWRYLDYDLGDSTPIKSIDFNGAALGVTFRF